MIHTTHMSPNFSLFILNLSSSLLYLIKKYECFLHMPQLVPFYFINQMTFAILLISITMYVLSKYILPKYVSLFLARLFITKL